MNNTAVRGAVLVVVIVLIGVLVLDQGLDDATIDPSDLTTTTTAPPAGGDDGGGDDAAVTDDGATGDDGSTADDGSATDAGSADGGDDSAAGDGSTTTTVPPATQVTSPPNEVAVLVLNAGSGVNGAAGTLTTNLAALGYATLPAANGPEQTRSFVYYEPGFQADAEAIAAALGAPEGSVAPMPSPAPAELQGADILILIGPDSLAQSG
ncbi:MAG: LytR C-terminal domain-containing protein [Acidimicrobiales bacterium]